MANGNLRAPQGNPGIFNILGVVDRSKQAQAASRREDLLKRASDQFLAGDPKGAIALLGQEDPSILQRAAQSQFLADFVETPERAGEIAKAQNQATAGNIRQTIQDESGEFIGITQQGRPVKTGIKGPVRKAGVGNPLEFTKIIRDERKQFRNLDKLNREAVDQFNGLRNIVNSKAKFNKQDAFGIIINKGLKNPGQLTEQEREVFTMFGDLANRLNQRIVDFLEKDLTPETKRQMNLVLDEIEGNLFRSRLQTAQESADVLAEDIGIDPEEALQRISPFAADIKRLQEPKNLAFELQDLSKIQDSKQREKAYRELRVKLPPKVRRELDKQVGFSE